MARLDILELISGGDYLLFVKEIFEYRIVVAGFREELMLKMSFTKKKIILDFTGGVIDVKDPKFPLLSRTGTHGRKNIVARGCLYRRTTGIKIPG